LGTSVDLLLAYVTQFFHLQEANYMDQFSGQVPQGNTTSSLLLQVPKEYLAFIQQGSISVAFQKEGMFQKGL
jgi:hypothetical protein